MESKAEHKAAAILAADIVGYSQLMGDNEEATLTEFRTILRQFVRPSIVRHFGRLIKFNGDAFLAEFSTISNAFHCALAIQSTLEIHNTTIPKGRKLFFRIGLHWGDVVVEGEDLLGDTVNIAARLESVAETGGLAISGVVRAALGSLSAVQFVDQGLVTLKNIKDPVSVFKVEFDPAVFAKQVESHVMQPYRGLAAFREEDAAIFFGRESFVALLEKTVQDNSLVTVIGSSGSGKSSVVAAGLIPIMRSRDWLIARFRPGSQPFVELANALQPLLLPDSSAAALRSATHSLAMTMNCGEVNLLSLSKNLRQRYPDVPGILLIADQFEEFLTLCTDRVLRERFQDLILSGHASIKVALARGEDVLPLVIVMTLRADFMGRMLEYRPLADAMQHSDIKLGPMNREELKRTIENPARQQGVGFAPGLVERILDDVGEEPGNLPLLEFALTALWRKDSELGAELSHQAYEEIGRVQGALAYHADDVFAALQPSEQSLAQQIFVQLIQPGEGIASTRRVATRQELGETGWLLTQRLADSRLVITGRNAAGEETVELVHEALIRDWSRLRKWLREDFAFRSWQERLRDAIELWQSGGEDQDGLLRGTSLAQAVDWLETHGARLSELERTYIEQSQQLLQQKKLAEKEQLQRERDLIHVRKNERRLKIFTAALAGVLALAVGATLFAWKQQSIAVEAQGKAELERQLAQQARDKTDETLIVVREAQAESEAARQRVQQAKNEVDKLNRQILSQHLAAESFLANENATDRASGLPLLLATKSVNATLEDDGYSLLVANNALRQAVRTAPDAPWKRLAGHTGKIQTVWFNATGDKLLTGGHDKLVNLWDTRSGQLLHTFEGHQQRITQARFVNNDQQVITTSMDGTIRVWDTETGILNQTISDHKGAVYDLIVSHDEKHWLSISFDKTARLIDAQTGETMFLLEGQDEPLYAAAISRDGNRIVTGGDHSAALWDAKTGQLMEKLDTGIPAIRSIEFTDDSRLFLLRGEYNKVDVRYAENGQRVYLLEGHDQSVIWSAGFSPDSASLLTAGGDGTIRSWSAEAGKPEKIYIGTKAAVSEAVYNHDGTMIASAAANGAAKLWRVGDSKSLRTFEGHVAAVSNIRFSPDHKLVVTTGEDGNAILWRIEDLIDQQLQDGFNLKGHGSGGQAVAFDPVHARAATASYDGSLLLWDTQTLTILAKMRDASDESIYFVDFSPDGKQLVSVGSGTDVSLWDLDSHSLVSQHKVAGSALLWSEYNHRGDHIITTSVDGTAAIVDAGTGKPVHKLKGHDGAVFWAGFSPDDKLVATASYTDNTARIWDAISGKALHVLRGHSGGVYRCGFSADGNYLVTASNDTTAKVWDTRSGNLVFDLTDHTSTVRAAAFSPDGRFIVTASYDKTAKIWDAKNGELLRTLPGHQANLMTITFASDSSWFLTTSYDNTAKIWEMESGRELHTLLGHADKLEAAAISPDNQLILTQGQDDTPRIWRSRVTDLLKLAGAKMPRSRPDFTESELQRFQLGEYSQR